MNNQFLQHLKSITPQGKAEEKKIFISAERLKELEAEELDEATRSKYLKVYGKHKVGTDTGALELARKKHDAAIMRRGGASPEAVKRGLANEYGIDHEVDMAKYRFANKRAKHLDKAIANYNRKASKSTNEAVSTNDPNRGRMGRAKPKLPPGLDPYDMYSKGEIQPYGGKLQKRLRSMSAEDRKRYYQQIGIRSRAASRSGKTQRLFPMTEGVKRMRRLRSARFGQQGTTKELDAAYDKELSKVSASRLRRGGAPKQTVRAFFTDKPTTKAADKAYSKFSKDAMNKASAKGKKIFEATKVGKKIKRKIVKAKNRLRNIGRRVVDTLGTPQDNTDYMLTGRKF
jgi:hypothetical protein